MSCAWLGGAGRSVLVTKLGRGPGWLRLRHPGNLIKYYYEIVKPESEVPKSRVPKSRPKGLGLTQ